ncbi:hypothetical protein Ga0102493_11106 [Erythrobacter litoralis]|nr:hypothetical protein Ga0102493_11106 [Erythrobacter litoralis]
MDLAKAFLGAAALAALAAPVHAQEVEDEEASDGAGR